MTVTDVRKDPDALTLTITSEFAAALDRVWQLWADPRRLEKWWGPPTYPATFVDHDLTPGGRVTYYMTGPEGDQARGWWKVLAVEAPTRLEFEDGFADEDWNNNPKLPTTRGVVTLTEAGGRTRMQIETTFGSVEEMEKLVAMGMEEGMAQAVGQMDALLASESATR